MNPPSPSPTVSVVVSTNGRLAGLRALVNALRFQCFRNFELCIVRGPAHDGTGSYLRELQAAEKIKAGFCPEPNISRSRNIGVALAAGELIAFVDDDAIPEPTWLAELVGCFGNASVSGAGGSVFQPDGFGLQFRFSFCDRFGNADHTPDVPADDGAFPLSARFPHVMGTNCMFRRDALAAIGGFDEEYDYYLDEADLCCRLVDEGFGIRQNAAAAVHHKFLAGTVRDHGGITVRHYPVLKNQIYFALMNGRAHASIGDILARSAAFIAGHRSDLHRHVQEGRAYPLALRDFDDAVERAWEVGLKRGLSGNRRRRDRRFFSSPEPFRRFLPGDEEAKGAIAILLPLGDNDNGLHFTVMEEARKMADSGLTVRTFEVLQRPEQLQSVDFLDNVWIHRIGLRLGTQIGKDDRARAGAIAAEIDRISEFCPVERIIDKSGLGLAALVETFRQD